MKFFNIDLHISVIEDIKTIFNDLGHEVDSKCLSFHTWVFNRTVDKVDIIGQHNWNEISPEMCDAFYERYKDELSDYDGFIVTHTPCFALLYEKFNKPIITVASTRYEAPFTTNLDGWDQFNNFLRERIDSGLIIPVTNNLYDKKYTEHFTHREWEYIPSLCEYTNLKYTGTKEDFIFYTKCKDITLPNIVKKETIGDGSWENIYSHKGIIHIPYNISTMSIFEQKTAGVPLIFPSLDYLLEIHGNLAELFHGGIQEKREPPNNTNNDFWRQKENVQFADFYQWKEVLYFDSEDHLSQLLDVTDFKKVSERSLKENEIIKKETYKKWENILSKISKQKTILKLASVVESETWGGQPFPGEGSLFNNENKEASNEQVKFLTEHLNKIKPKTILETGTHTAFFDFLASDIIPNVKIYTFGISDFSKRAVEILKKEKNPNIEFFEGDSRETLSNFNTEDQIDFAWVDGGHFGDVPITDLKNCNRLKIPHILIDDYRYVPDVPSAVEQFLSETNYKIISESGTKDNRGIVYLSNCPKTIEDSQKTSISDITFGLLTSGRTDPDTPGATISVRSSDSAQAVLETWGKDVPNIYFATDVDMNDHRFIKSSDRNDYRSTGQKQINLSLHMFNNLPKTKWYFLADDDSYIYKDNLLELLDQYKTDEPVAIGKVIDCCSWDWDLLYLSGGAGMAFNRAAFEKVCEFFSFSDNKDSSGEFFPGCGEMSPYEHHTTLQIYGDVAIGYALKYFNIKPITCDGFFGRPPESAENDQLKHGIELKKKLPELKEAKTDNVISYHSISSQRCREENWENFKKIEDVCQK